MKPGDITTHRGRKVILGPEFDPGQGSTAQARGKPGEKWFRYLDIDPESPSWSAQGAAPESEFGVSFRRSQYQALEIKRGWLETRLEEIPETPANAARRETLVTARTLVEDKMERLLAEGLD